MFGAAKPATGFGGFGTAAPTAPAVGAAQPAATGGFGFTSTNTSNNVTSTTGGWGTAAAPSALALGTAATGGWGAKPAAVLGWGFPSQQPQQQQQQGMGGWGTQQQQSQQQLVQQQQQPYSQPPANYTILQNFARQSALASFLMELDKAYDALGPKCRFRTFAYNVCQPGQVADAVQRERYIAFLNGGGVPEEEWMAALQRSPDPSRLYPQPLHFARELRQRCDKQKAELARLADVADGYLRDVAAVAATDEVNKHRLRAMRRTDVMLRRRWHLLQCKLEVLSRLGARPGEEGLLLRQVEQLRQVLGAPGMYRDALQSLQPLLDDEAELSAERRSVARLTLPMGHLPDSAHRITSSAALDEPGLLRSHVDAQVMEGWVKFAEQMQDGIQSLHDLLSTDKKDMVAIRERVAQR